VAATAELISAPVRAAYVKVPLADRYFKFAVSPAAGAGTKPLVPPEPESPTKAVRPLVRDATGTSVGAVELPVRFALTVLAGIGANFALVIALSAINLVDIRDK
jgi:hypothetical protein